MRVVSGDTGSTDTGGGSHGGGTVDTAAPDTGWGDPARPPANAYSHGLFGGCETGPTAPLGLFWLAFASLVPLVSRRRRA